MPFGRRRFNRFKKPPGAGGMARAHRKALRGAKKLPTLSVKRGRLVRHLGRFGLGLGG